MAGRYRIKTISDCKGLRNNAGAVQEIDLDMVKSAEFETEIEELEYEGDGTKTIVYYLSALTIALAYATFHVSALRQLFGKTVVTAGLPSGVSERDYFGANSDAGGIICGIKVICQAQDLDSGANIQLAIVCPRGTLSTLTPPALENLSPPDTELQFSAEKTTVDIAGNALPGVPSDGAFWYVDCID